MARVNTMTRLLAYSIIILLTVIARQTSAEDDPLTRLVSDTVAYFRPMSGTITKVEDKKVFMSLAEKDGLRKGMRLKVTRQGAPFIHPVTGEVLGKYETTVGLVEVREVNKDFSLGDAIGTTVKEGDLVRISDTKSRLLFAQDNSVEWYLGDEFYRRLKNTGRVEITDYPIGRHDAATVIADAKKAGDDIALVLSAKESGPVVLLTRKMYWTTDASMFSETEMQVDAKYAQQLKFGEKFFAPQTSGSVLKYDLPFSARLVASADINGDGRNELVIATGNDISVYAPGADLHLLWQIKGVAGDDYLWLETADLNNDGREEIIISGLRNNESSSTIYQFNGAEFTVMWSGKVFLRRLGGDLLIQEYSENSGFTGRVHVLSCNGGSCSTGQGVKLPADVNLYDFTYMSAADGKNMVFAQDDKGFLNLYDEKGVRLWRSSADTGGFIRTFKKKESVSYLDPGEWSVKDKLFSRQKEVLVVKRHALSNVAKGLGHTRSDIMRYWWNGTSMEEAPYIDDISGSIMDYAVANEQVVVLTSPIMGIKFGNILKGENPLGSMLYIYSVKAK